MKKPFLFIAMLLMSITLFAADPYEPALILDDLDLRNTDVWIREKKDKDDKQAKFKRKLFTIKGLQNLVNNKPCNWSAGVFAKGGKSQTSYRYRLAFKKAMPIGYMMATTTKRNWWLKESIFKYLKASAPYPGDPDNDDHWENIKFDRFSAITFPPGFKTRAMLYYENRIYGHSKVVKWFFVKKRLFNMTPYCYTQGETAKWSGRPKWVTYGSTWTNSGSDPETKINSRMNITRRSPSWFHFRFKKKESPVALRFTSNIEKFRLLRFKGPKDLNPVPFKKKDWEIIDELKKVYKVGKEQVVTFKTPPTYAIRIEILETKPAESKVCSLGQASIYVDLKDQKTPRTRPKIKFEFPPNEFEFTAPQDGDVAIVVDNLQGHRIRNVVAQVQIKKGANALPWNLKDYMGVYLEPREYPWKGIVGPKLMQIEYMMTPYPNLSHHSPKSRPWPGGARDAFLSNHNGGRNVTSAGDYTLISSGGTEGGHAFIALDKNGEKIYGRGGSYQNTFKDWDGNLYHQSGFNITRVNTKRNFRFEKLISVAPTKGRKGTLNAIAIHKDKLYVAYQGVNPIFDKPSLANTGNCDIINCHPRLRPTIKGKENYGYPATPRRDYMHMFRLGSYVAGMTANKAVPWLESTKGYGSRQYMTLLFKKPVPLGSLTFPAHEDQKLEMRIAILKKGAKYPPKKNGPDWIDIPIKDLQPWNCLPVPPNTFTRGLRITFAQKGGDLMEAIEDGEGNPDEAEMGSGLEGDDDVMDDLKTGTPWRARLEGMRLMRRRLVSHMKGAKILINSGRYSYKTGVWKGLRKKAVLKDDPGIFVIDMMDVKTIHGLAIKEINGLLAEIDVCKKAPGTPLTQADLTNEAIWEKVANYKQKIRNSAHHSSTMNLHARYLDGYVNFGTARETRAIRIRITKAIGAESRGGHRPDRGPKHPTFCGIYGVAPIEWIKGEPTTDALSSSRMAVFDLKTKKLLREMPNEIKDSYAYNPTDRMAFNQHGELYACSKDKIVHVNKETMELTTVKLTGPGVVAPRFVFFDDKDRMYVYDHIWKVGPHIKVFDKTGKYLHNIGNVGKQKAGKYDPKFIGDCSSVSWNNGFVWVVYPYDNPRRVIKFKDNGEHAMDYLGNTYYGGGGVLDTTLPANNTFLYFKDLAFQLDLKKDTHKLTHFLSMNWGETGLWGKPFRADWTTIKYKGRTYFCNAPLMMQFTMPVGAVYVQDPKTKAVRFAAAFGKATSFSYLMTEKVAAYMAEKRQLIEQQFFMWSDLNGNGKVDFLTEVKFSKRPPDKPFSGIGRFDDELGAMGGKNRFVVDKLLDDGTPIYKEINNDFPAIFKMPSGKYINFGSWIEGSSHNVGYDKNGKRTWFYPATYDVSGLWAGAWSPGYITNQFGISGVGNAHVGELGEFFVTHANNGQMNIFTSDGLLAGHITLHQGDPRARRWGSEFQQGARYDGMTMGQEHFHHFFGQTPDNRYFIVGGGDNTGLFEIKGWEKFKRIGGKLRVTPEMIKKARAWDKYWIDIGHQFEPKVLYAAPVKTFAQLDADSAQLKTSHFKMGYGIQRLFFQWKVTGNGPLRNIGEDFRRYFKTGSAVDVKLALNPDADPNRKKPVEGDIRILVTKVKGKPVAVLYRSIAPNAKPGEAWSVTTPAGGTTSFDQVRILTAKEASIKIIGSSDSYTVNLSIPMK
ncbi:MAG: hypothetical protein HRT89_21570, partial [Lentisphaeria bacterium]|nr:hypothetical protein [Lentisphaeria bacterium]